MARGFFEKTAKVMLKKITSKKAMRALITLYPIKSYERSLLESDAKATHRFFFTKAMQKRTAFPFKKRRLGAASRSRP
jgi:hypothetical protein